ncbi:hypothetical protein [Vulcanisaeta sp. JCM 14467]|uniref:hypothetical protein n=1 Tax=Vulcanisaeta sp. JCM 14467 TaxID=1295370 RepID=UPI000AA963A3|nr:hypothetical protein [Vulcanisaeta sp. JCM 14467]
MTIILLYLYTPQIIKVINTTAPNLLNQASTVTGSLPSNGTVLDTIYLIPYLAYVFPFVNFILSVGGEVRRGSAMPIAIYGTYAISAIFLALGIWVTTSSLGINRLNGYSPYTTG